LKVLPLAGGLDPRQLQRFKTEAQAAALLHHTNIVPIHAVGSERGVHYYAMQFIDGQTLAQLINERRTLEQPPPSDGGPSESPAVTPAARSATLTPSSRTREFLRRAVLLGIQAAEALEHAHVHGVIHRDIKPANLLLDAAGHLWVTDFGLARLQDDNGLTMTGDLLGTLRYMSPEQALARWGYLDHRTDIYSLGATLYELLTLRPAIDGQNRQEVLRRIAEDEPTPPRWLDPSIPRELETILLKAMDKEPRSRYATAQELGDDLRRFLEHKPIRARPPSIRERLAKWVRRNRDLVTAAAIMLVMTVVLLAVSIVLVEGQRRRALANYRAAEHQRGLATDRAEQLREKSEQLEWQLYVSLVNRAHTEWLANNVALADQLLAECPPNRRGWEWHFCRRLGHLEQLTLPGPGHPFLSLTFSPDSRWIVTTANSHYLGTGVGEWTIWEATTGRAIERRPVQGVRKVAIDASGTRIAVGSNPEPGKPYTVTLWQTTMDWPPRLARAPDLVLRPEPARTEPSMTDLAFSPDGQQLAAVSFVEGGGLGLVETWDLRTGLRLHRIEIHSGGVRAVVFRPDGSQLATACLDGTIRLWDARTGGTAGVLRGHTGEVFDVAYSPDGRRLVTGGRDQTVRIWESASGSPIHVLPGHESFVRAVAFNGDGTRIASASEDRTVRLWDAATGTTIGILRGHTRFVLDVAFSPDGRRVASASEDGTVKLWDATAPEPARTIPHAQWVRHVAFFPDGSTLASACSDGSVRLWNGADAHELGQPLRMTASQVVGLAIRSDGTSLAASDRFAVIRLWDAATGRLLHDLRGHEKMTCGIAFRPDGRQLASTSQDGTLRLWDTETGQSWVFFRAPSGVKTIAVVYRPDGRQLAVALTDSTVRILDATSGVEQLRLDALLPDVIESVGARIAAYDTAGRWLAVCSNPGDRVPGEVKVFDAATGRLGFTLRGHTSNVVAVAFSPDGSRIATASFDQTVKLWDAATGREAFTIRGHKGGVLSVAFSPDGRRIATGSIDNSARIWDATPLDVIEHRRASGTREEESPQRSKP
jgi:WD40 repeat protein